MKTKTISVLLSALLMLTSLQVLAEKTPRWTLSASIRQAMQVSPEMKIAIAEIGGQQGNLEQADAWPNPSINIQADNALGLEDESGGYDVTQYAITQSLPITRLSNQREEAEARLARAEAHFQHQRLLLEFEVSQHFHNFQLTEEKLKLAKARLQQALRYQSSSSISTNKNSLVRFLTPLETMRLDIVLQAARQTMEVAEGKFSEAAASFKFFLGIMNKNELMLAALTPVPAPGEFSILENSLLLHPALQESKKIVVASQAGVAVAKSKRFDDPTLTLFRRNEYLADQRQNSTGIMLSIQFPLWNLNSGDVNKARQSVHYAQAALNLRKRELSTNLRKSYLHLGHLIKQAEHYRKRLLKPAKKVFALTKKGFGAGQLNVLTLIDANNTYFDAQERYLELLQEGWQELAEVRKSAGLFLLTDNSKNNTGEAK